MIKPSRRLLAIRLATGLRPNIAYLRSLEERRAEIIRLLKEQGVLTEELEQKIALAKVLVELEDIYRLTLGMVLTGVVRNVVGFGALVGIGVHQDGLVHISTLSDSFVGNPLDVVNVGDIVKVKVIGIDLERKRISLSMGKAVERWRNDNR